MSAGDFAREPVRKVFLLAVIGTAIWAAYWTLRLARADQLSRAPGIESAGRAVELAPADADFRLRLAVAQQAAGVDSRAALVAATTLDAAGAEAWIRRGLNEEMAGDLPSAERSLLTAASASRQFAPRWALANYYFRRNDETNFWPWVKEALRIGYGDLTPVFRLCWGMHADNGLVLAQALPDRRMVVSQYLWFLMQEGRGADSGPVAVKLAELAGADDRRALLAWCDRQLAAGHGRPALEVWNILCAQHLLRAAAVDPDRAPLTDGDFAGETVEGGFAWRLAGASGVSIDKDRPARMLTVTFDGNQPEQCAPLWQFVLLSAGAHHRFDFEYQTTELPAASGLRWSVSDVSSGAELTDGWPWLSSPGWKSENLEFRAPANGLVRLTLTCRRLPGFQRPAGSIALRGLRLERRP